jgi:hypothetical protein
MIVIIELFVLLIVLFFSSSLTQQPTSQPSRQPTTQPTARIPSSLKNGLVAYYPFDGHANDQSGNSHHGVVHGGLTSTTDRFGLTNRAYSFDGTSAHITIDNGQTFHFANNFSISFWIYASPTQGSVSTLLSKSHADPCCSEWTIESASSNNNYYSMYVMQVSATWGTSVPLPVSPSSWTHVVVIKENANLKSYINGVFQSKTTSTDWRIKSNGNSPLYLGATYDSVSSGGRGFFHGSLDEIYIYNRSLSSSEIRQVYKIDVFDSPPYGYENTKLVLWYPFVPDIANYASGVPVMDATLVNGATRQSVGYNRDGGGALLLNSASSQYMSINTFTTGPNGISIAVWFKSNNNPLWARVFDIGNGPNTNNLLLAPSFAAVRYIYQSGEYDVTLPAICNTNVWCFIVFTATYSTSPTGSTWNLYNNGTFYSTAQNPYPASGSRSSNFLGKSNWADPYYKGLIGEFRLYDTVLTPAEIQALYQGWVLPSGQPTEQSIRTAKLHTNSPACFLPFGATHKPTIWPTIDTAVEPTVNSANIPTLPTTDWTSHKPTLWPAVETAHF